MGISAIPSQDFHSSSLKICSVHMKSLAFLRVNSFWRGCLAVARESSWYCGVIAGRSAWIPVRARYRYPCG